jgi:hypothetical protein
MLMHAAIRMLPAFVLSALVGGPTHAQESAWTRSFAPEAVGTYLPAGKNEIVVVTPSHASGSERIAREEEAAAAAALQTAFRQCAGQVMDATSLGSLAGLDDAEIVKKAAGMPVNRVAILRLSSEDPWAPMRAAVTVYDKAGTVVAAFSAVAGSPLEPTGKTATSAEGNDTSATDGVAGQVATSQADRKKAREIYDRFIIGFDDWAGVVDGRREAREWTQPWQGKDRKPLEGADFYRAIGRLDLVAKYRSHQRIKTGLAMVGALVVAGGGYLVGKGSGESERRILGYVLGVAGLTMVAAPWSESSHLLYGLADRRSSGEDGSVVGYRPNRGLRIGLTILGATIVAGGIYTMKGASGGDSDSQLLGGLLGIVGVTMAVVPWWSSSHPISAGEARRLADEHNQELKAKVGLSLVEERPSPPVRLASRLFVAPTVLAYPRGGGLGLLGRF